MAFRPLNHRPKKNPGFSPGSATCSLLPVPCSIVARPSRPLRRLFCISTTSRGPRRAIVARWGDLSRAEKAAKMIAEASAGALETYCGIISIRLLAN